MLKTNTKKVRQNVQNYILKNFEDEEFSGNAESFKEVSEAIYERFLKEKFYNDSYCYKKRISELEIFEYWAQGLPSILDTCYYYNRSAVKDLGEILEETEEEKSKYTEQDAEQMLTYLIYREIKKAIA